MTSSAAPTYTFGGATPKTSKKNSFKKKHHKRGGHKHHDSEDHDPTDGEGSLSYSAASSVNSGGSAAGESTDSSFADIMRVLDLQEHDSKELRDLCKKEGVNTAGELREKRGLPSSGAYSVASSLNYSIDGESHLEGSNLLQTIAGQPSDQYYDGGSNHEASIQEDSGLLFAPAAPAENRKQKKEKKRREKNATPRTRNTDKPLLKLDPDSDYDTADSSFRSTPTKMARSPDAGKPATPPPLPPKGIMLEDDEDIWYAKWWMSCFPDSLKGMMPKR